MLSRDEQEQRLHRALIGSYETAKRELGYNATRFLQMIGELGATETARRLAADPQLSEGFERMWEEQRLELTVEAQVVRPEFEGLFPAEVRQQAEKKLREVGWKPSPE
jgi:hypothetical protein